MAVREILGHHFFDNDLNQDSVVIDLGAYKGEFSRQIEYDYNCRVFAIEASPASFKHTYRSGRVKKFNYAICGNCEPVKFFLGSNPEGNSICQTHRDVAEEYVEIPGITLPVFLHQHQLIKIDLLKVDIEGAEIDLIKSMNDDELKNIRQLTVECHDFIKELNIEQEVRSLKKRMTDLGFECIVFQYPNKDVLFVNRYIRDIHRLNLYRYKRKAQLRIYKRHISIFVRTFLKRINIIHAYTL